MEKAHNPQFLLDLKNSQKKEQEFVQALAKVGLTASTTQDFECFASYDVSATGSTGRISYYEIKTNTSNLTGKTFLELQKSIDGKKEEAGLSATKADYYVFTFKNNPRFYIIRTSKLRKMKFEHKYYKGNYLLGILNTDTLLSACDAVL